MPAAARRRAPLLVDSSLAVALVVADHKHHRAARAAVAGRRLGLAGHAAFETFSVLTRLPPPARRTAATVGRLLASSFPETRYLGVAEAARLFAGLAERSIAGGAVYDALIGAVAIEHDLPLASRDARAAGVYEALGVKLELVR